MDKITNFNWKNNSTEVIAIIKQYSILTSCDFIRLGIIPEDLEPQQWRDLLAIAVGNRLPPQPAIETGEWVGYFGYCPGGQNEILR